MGIFNTPYQPRVELSYFSRDNPREWLRKCNKYFLVFQVPKLLKADSIEVFLEGRAKVWYPGVKFSIGKIYWLDFCDPFTKRFGDKGRRDEMEEFNKLQQLGIME